MVSPQHRNAVVDLDDLKATASAISGRWKVSILACLAQHPYRFAALRRAIGRVSEKVLVQALRDLEEEQLISRTVEQVVPPRVEYAMTDHGRSLCDVVWSMAEWGSNHRRVLASSRIEPRHGEMQDG